MYLKKKKIKKKKIFFLHYLNFYKKFCLNFIIIFFYIKVY